MRVIRAVPEVIPPYRNYVVDQVEQWPMWDYDMSHLAKLNDDVLLFEWDVVMDLHHIKNMINFARMSPHRVQVAPYVLHPVSTGLVAPVWAHRTMINEV